MSLAITALEIGVPALAAVGGFISWDKFFQPRRLSKNQPFFIKYERRTLGDGKEGILVWLKRSDFTDRRFPSWMTGDTYNDYWSGSDPGWRVMGFVEADSPDADEKMIEVMVTAKQKLNELLNGRDGIRELEEIAKRALKR